MGTNEFVILIISTISIIILLPLCIYSFKEGRKWTKEDKWYLYAVGSLIFLGVLANICLIVHIVGGN